MKNIKKYLAIALSLAVFMPILTGCSDDEQSQFDSISVKPSERFDTKIHFVSRLSNASAASSDADYTALSAYVAKHTAANGSWVTVIDRADATLNGANMTKNLKIALDNKRWSALAFNRITNNTQFEGSMLLFNNYTTSMKGYPVTADCYVTGFAPIMLGTRADQDDAGTVTYANVSFPVNFRTARFTTDAQISAFGGDAGVMNQLKREKMNLLMVGTVKSDLLSNLSGTVSNTDESFVVTPIVADGDYTLFLLAEKRFWALTRVETESLSSGLNAYTIHIMW